MFSTNFIQDISVNYAWAWKSTKQHSLVLKKEKFWVCIILHESKTEVPHNAIWHLPSDICRLPQYDHVLTLCKCKTQYKSDFEEPVFCCAIMTFRKLIYSQQIPRRKCNFSWQCFKILSLRKKWKGFLIIWAWRWTIGIGGAVLKCVKVIGNIYTVPAVSFVHSSAFYLQICFFCFTQNKQTHSLAHMHAHLLGF